MHDILIKNGTVVDGTGAKGEKKDVAINGGMITEIGDLTGDQAREVIDASELTVVPGFIDISNRSDTRWRLFLDPQMESMIYQGVTTIIGGNSGTSLAPIYNEEMMQALRKWHDVSSINIDWQSMEDFLAVIEKRNLAVNFGTFVGYGTLRRGITGDVSRTLTDTELVSIKKHITESIQQGALGVSTGLVYSHEKKVTKEELMMIGNIVAENGGLFVAHLRDEGERILEAVDEVLDVQNVSHARTHISHLKVMQKKNWSLMEKLIEKIEKTPVVFDIYPYTFSATVLYTFLPEWVSEGGRRMMLERLRNKKIRERVVSEMNNGYDLSDVVVAETQRSHYYCGKTFRDIAKKQGNSVNEAVMDVLLASDGQVVVFCESISEENIARGIRSKNSVISSNGMGLTITKRNENIEHPRSFGAFPRVFAQYVQQQGVCDIETMINKCTYKVAQELGLRDRGKIANNMKADIVIIDPKEFADHVEQVYVYHYAQGVRWSIINGQIAVKYGKYTGVRSGEIIKK
ncbi:MAG: hypothetical protein WC819_02350 [Parcubacteria group bacterium]|jgi:N-acyl-D-amino-acid deacylase